MWQEVILKFRYDLAMKNIKKEHMLKRSFYSRSNGQLCNLNLTYAVTGRFIASQLKEIKFCIARPNG